MWMWSRIYNGALLSEEGYLNAHGCINRGNITRVNNGTVIWYSRTTSTNTAFCSSNVNKCCTSSSSSLMCRPLLAMAHHYTNNEQLFKGTVESRPLPFDSSMSLFSRANWILGRQPDDECGHAREENDAGEKRGWTLVYFQLCVLTVLFWSLFSVSSRFQDTNV